MVGTVQVPLLAIGKLLRRGWQVINDGEVKLQDPFGRAAVVEFRHNSLALHTQRDRDQRRPSPHREPEDFAAGAAAH